MKNSIYPAFWFDQNAKEAMQFYCSTFKESLITEENDVVVCAEIYGFSLIGINGGPIFKANPSISLMLFYQDKIELDQVWEKLSEQGQVLMPLQQYPWSEHFGWVQDKYGFSWQLNLGDLQEVGQQKVIPNFMFSGHTLGKCKKALEFYQDLFRDMHVQGIQYQDAESLSTHVKHCQFSVHDLIFMARDGDTTQDFTFNEAISMVIECRDQAEIDYYWDKITENGTENRCGWCKDQFGVSWQIVPENMGQILKQHGKAQLRLMSMNKIIIDQLLAP